MAKHKAATEVTFVTEERSAFAEFVHRYKFHAVAVAVAISVFVLWQQSRGEAAVSADREIWQDLYLAQRRGGQPSDLAAVATRHAGTEVGAWARVQLGLAQAERGAFADAKQSLSQANESGALLVSRLTLPIGPDGAEESIADRLQRLVAARAEFENEHSAMYSNPPAPEGSPEVVLHTGEGDITVRLYADEAPEHVRNFLELARDGFYDGTKFHRVLPGFMIQGGDPNSIDGDPATWGQGGPGYKIDREENDLVHARGVLAAAKQPQEIQSSGSQFYLTVAPAHHLDGQHVVYGQVVDGLDVMEAIEARPPSDANPQRPADPVVLTGTTVRE